MHRSKLLLTLAGIFVSLALAAQSEFSGSVINESGKPVPYATVALLKPADSTLASFGITNDDGNFGIKRISNASYLLQIACMGYKTYYESISFPAKAGNYGIIVLKTVSFQLPSAEIVAEHIPLIVKKDTLEYNAAAFKTKPDAVAEDLLKKLPGVEVDRSGNIKAMGEDVKNVMVDGKEFFSSDPKVATKNLPADAISKVQVYDKKSESAELAGIDDGSRDKTINLLLKDGKKQAWIGDVSAGAGTADKYSVSGKAYRFTRKDQFAALGMLNNINKFGFSFQDYIDFNGGLPSLMSGGSLKLTITSDEELPVNFGQTINGLVSSGAGGLNYSFDIRKNNRLYASYLGSGSNRRLDQTSVTQNFLPESAFTENEISSDNSNNASHRFNMGWKDKSDSTRTLLFNANLSLTGGKGNSSLITESFRETESVSSIESKIDEKRSGINGNASFSYLARGKNAVKLYKLNANTKLSRSLDENDRLNLLKYTGIETPVTDNQFRDLTKRSLQAGITSGMLIRLAPGLYTEPELSITEANDVLLRKQGLNLESELSTDSLSPDFNKNSLQFNPGIKIRWNQGKHKIVPGLSLQLAKTSNSLNKDVAYNDDYFRVLPFFSWEYEISTSHRLNLDYTTTVNEPSANMMIPVVDNANPRSLFYGNRELKPETMHEISANWFLFDQFSRTSVFARFSGRYTTDMFGYSRTISDSLVQTISVINTKSGEEYSGSINFSTPLHRTGVNLHISLETRLTKGITIVNSEENRTTGSVESVRLSFDKIKKEKWDLDIGAEMDINNAKYSIMSSLNNRYLTLNYFADLTLTPSDKWSLGVNSDILNYGAGNFSSSESIPLISAEIGYNFLKNNRARFKLECFDILDKNKGLERINELNYMREVRSNTVGRYVLLSFSYRLNKAAGQGSGLEIKMNKH
jgi:hypothetical protein